MASTDTNAHVLHDSSYIKFHKRQIYKDREQINDSSAGLAEVNSRRDGLDMGMRKLWEVMKMLYN